MTSPSIEASQIAYKQQLSLLRSLFRKANRADENLGQYKIGPSLCRVTPESARDVMRAFTRAEALFSPASDVDIERHFVDLGSGRSLVCLAALAHWADPTMRATGWEINGGARVGVQMAPGAQGVARSARTREWRRALLLTA